MSSLRRIDLEFNRSALHHVATRYNTQEHGAGLPENDTIVSAAAVAWFQVTGEFSHAWFDESGAGGIACSSLLPTIKDERGKTWLYLPIPPKTLKIDTANQLHLLKIVNRIAWLRKDLWQIWAEGQWEKSADIVLDEYFQDCNTSEPPIALSQFDSHWVKKSVQERVTLHPDMLLSQAMSETGNNEEEARKQMKASMPYRVTSFRFTKNAGASIVFDAGEHNDQFVKALALLGHSGLGGDRTYGYGQFDISSKGDTAFSPHFVPNTDATLTLGLMYPGAVPADQLKSALSSGESRWSVVTRQGRNTVPLTDCVVVSKSVRMVGKGALLTGCPYGAVGCAANVFPESWKPEKQCLPPFSDRNFWAEERKRIWRSGRTIALPAKLPADGGDV